MSQKPQNIIHLGPGNFFMGHLATYVQDMNDRGSNYNITGISLNSTCTRDKLLGQDGYTVTEVGAKGKKTKKISAMSKILAATDKNDRAKIDDLFAQGDASVISCTVTALGYYFNKTQGFLINDPKIQECLNAQNGCDVVTTLGFINQALHYQYENKQKPAAVVSLDNLSQNGDILRAATIAYAEQAAQRKRYDQEYVDWLKSEVAFPNTMVDRIVPTFNADHKDYLEDQGFRDEIAIKTEDFRQLVVETRGNELPESFTALEAVGVQFVPDALPYEAVKIRMLNGTHMFLGLVANLALSELGVAPKDRTVFAAMQIPEVSAVTQQFMTATAKTLNVPPLVVGDNKNADVNVYAEAIKERLLNPELSDELSRLTRETLNTKLLKRCVEPMAELMRDGQNCSVHVLEIASYIVHARGKDLQNQDFNINDPTAVNLGIPEIANEVFAGRASSKVLLDKLNENRVLGESGLYLASSKNMVQEIDDMVHNIATKGMSHTIKNLKYNS